MNLSASQRADIETALDTMAAELKAHGLLRHPVSGHYLRAIRIVREIPPGHRRVRSDLETQRDGRQRRLAVDE